MRALWEALEQPLPNGSWGIRIVARAQVVDAGEAIYTVGDNGGARAYPLEQSRLLDLFAVCNVYDPCGSPDGGCSQLDLVSGARWFVPSEEAAVPKHPRGVSDGAWGRAEEIVSFEKKEVVPCGSTGYALDVLGGGGLGQRADVEGGVDCKGTGVWLRHLSCTVGSMVGYGFVHGSILGSLYSAVDLICNTFGHTFSKTPLLTATGNPKAMCVVASQSPRILLNAQNGSRRCATTTEESLEVEVATAANGCVGGVSVPHGSSKDDMSDRGCMGTCWCMWLYWIIIFCMFSGVGATSGEAEAAGNA